MASSDSSSSSPALNSATSSLTDSTESMADLAYHMSLLAHEYDGQQFDETITAPCFTLPCLDDTKAHDQIKQYGLLAGMTPPKGEAGGCDKIFEDPRLFLNVSTPSSTFICGSQGSGKSHTLSCILENCLIPSNVGKLPNPLTGLLFYYDTFTSDSAGQPCEAAYLASQSNVQVRVLCSPSNFGTMKNLYSKLKVTVEPLRISQTDLNASRLLSLMGVNQGDGPTPLYLHSVQRILRTMRIEQQQNGGHFSFINFKNRLDMERMTSMQETPLKQRMDLLESFLPPVQIGLATQKKKGIPDYDRSGNSWKGRSGCLTIVDLSCPFVSPESACALFSICLGIFLETDLTVGRVIALDEAHKFMNDSREAGALTEGLLNVIRLQRHLGARVVIATQEPTISPKLLDLCSMTIVHRFTSPAWFQTLRRHLAAVVLDEINGTESGQGRGAQIFDEIVALRVGQALFFSPSSVIHDFDGQGNVVTRKLANKYIKIRTRLRLSDDGGRSIMA